MESKCPEIATISSGANLGARPTVDEDAARRTLEVHLFEFDRDIYGQTMEVWFEEFLRPERKFDGLDALETQIAKDVISARAVNR